MNTLFNDLPILDQTKQALQQLGFETATPIQSLAMPKMIEGIDLIAQAQTGTGKTFAFAIPIVEKVDVSIKQTQALILTPTRELTVQVYKEILKLIKFYPQIKVASIVGGESYEKQFKSLAQNPHIIVGTPGRMLDHIERKTIDLSHLTILTLDEADEMLKMGFQDDIERILQETPSSRQTVLFSATIPPFIKKIAKNYQRQPEIIRVESKTLTVDQVTQNYFVVKEEDKPNLLLRLLDYEQPQSAIIFANTKKDVDKIAESLQKANFTADALHGDLKQSQRTYVMNRFRSKQLTLLIATDVAARGLDVSDVEVVINYDIPTELEVYVHRIGRTGRAGKKGKTYAFITPRKRRNIDALESFTKTEIKKMDIPTPQDISKKQRSRFVQLLKKITYDVQADHQDIIEQLVDESHSETMLLNALIEHLKPQVQNYQEIEVIADKKTRNQQTHDSGRQMYVDAVINLGRKDQITPILLLEFFSKELKIYAKQIGDIKHMQRETIFGIKKDSINKITQNRKLRYQGKPIQIKLLKR